MLRRWPSLLLLTLLLLLLGGEGGFLYWRFTQPQENSFDQIISAVAQEDDVDPFLIRAVVWRESRFKPLTHGAADERGLMQVTPEAGERWAKAMKLPNFQPDDLYNPRTNIEAGTWYLRRSIRLWTEANVDDPVPFALAEYNAGRSNALKWVDPANPQDHTAFLDRITFPLTRKYVDVILAQRDLYRSALADNRWYRDFAAAHPAPAVTLAH